MSRLKNIEIAQAINSAVYFIKNDPSCASSLDDLESIVDILKGEIEENYPKERISRSAIKEYLLTIL